VFGFGFFGKYTLERRKVKIESSFIEPTGRSNKNGKASS